MVSVAAALVPFSSTTDANRALMGANMQRQAVPLIRSHAPFVGRGWRAAGPRLRRLHAGTSRRLHRERRRDAHRGAAGQRQSRNSRHLPDDEVPEVEPVDLLQQTPIVRAGDRVKPNDTLADVRAPTWARLALGQNVLVAFMPCRASTFEDSILVARRIAKDDVLYSISHRGVRVRRP